MDRIFGLKNDVSWLGLAQYECDRTGILARPYPFLQAAEVAKADGSINDLAQDYGRSHEEIEEAVRCELPAAA